MVNDKKSEVNHPKHYNMGKYECIDVLEDWKLDYHEASAVAYVCRAKHKGDYVKDIKKAIWYLERKLKLMEKLGIENENDLRDDVISEKMKERISELIRPISNPPSIEDTYDMRNVDL